MKQQSIKSQMRQGRQVIQLIIIAVILAAILFSCASTKTGCPSNVSHWERTHRFKA